MQGMKSLSDAQEKMLVVVAEVITPEAAVLDADRKSKMIAIIDSALMDRSEGMRKQFGTFLMLIRWATVLRYGRRFDRLDGARKTAALRWFQDCPIGLLRQGFWGLKALVFMGYYGQPECWGDLGYAPELGGREGYRHA
jgi:hypothetical protein